MTTFWQETQAKLVAIQHEYNLICRAWRTTTNSERDQQFQALASACLAEIQATIQQYGTHTRDTLEARPALNAPRQRLALGNTQEFTIATDRRRSARGRPIAKPTSAPDHPLRHARRP